MIDLFSIWTLSGFGGYLLICEAFEMIDGRYTSKRMLQLTPSILLGPCAIIVGTYLIWENNKKN